MPSIARRVASLPLLVAALAACNPDAGDDTDATPSTSVTLPGTGSDSAPGTDPTPTSTTTIDVPTTGPAEATSDTTVDPSLPGTAATSDTGDDTTTTGVTTDPPEETTDTTTDTGDSAGDNPLWNTPNLWYSVENSLVYIELDPADGSVVRLVHNELVADAPLIHGQNGLTMLEDGSLLGSRESEDGTQIFHIAAPPTEENTPAQATLLGVVPNDMPGDPLRIEALYTDCDGRAYLMDSGEDTSSAVGNRLLRFTGNYLQGDLAFEVITDLTDASVADIDDMSPGLVDGEISDSLGFAMDSSNLWQIDYTSGTGDELAGTSGQWGIHALGGPLFDDMEPRLYILSIDAELLSVSLDDYSDSAPLVVGPHLELDSGYDGWSGLAGPLTECMTTIPG